jgi:uncharacterized protein involved in outer membrane biogenesis
MSKLVKITISAIGSVIFLITIGVWYTASTVDPVKLTKLLSSSVKTATGRDLKITGPVSLSFFPVISVSAEGVSLSNASWASDSDMLTLKRIDLNIKTLPLLSKRIEVGSVKLAGLELFLQKNGAGKANWDFSTDASGGPSAANNDAGRSPVSDNLISVDSISIADAYIQYQDPSNAISSYQIRRLSLERVVIKRLYSLQ